MRKKTTEPVIENKAQYFDILLKMANHHVVDFNDYAIKNPQATKSVKISTDCDFFCNGVFDAQLNRLVYKIDFAAILKEVKRYFKDSQSLAGVAKDICTINPSLRHILKDYL